MPAVGIPGYEILGELGRGGMGVVYRARELSLKRDVALKMIVTGAYASVAERSRFLAEAETLARLRHPHIVQVLACGEYDGMPFFALEFIEGGTLAQRLQGRPQPPRDAARALLLFARAVHAAHRQGVLHRDLKPANVLLAPPCDEEALNCAYGCPKISDFGIARQMGGNSQTASGTILGSPSYMAPEQAGGMRDLGPAADIYSLGVIFYEMLTGHPPFRGDGILATLELVRTQPPEPPTRLQPDVPAVLEAICLRCLKKLPGERYATAQELADELRRWLDVTAAPASKAATPAREEEQTVPFISMTLPPPRGSRRRPSWLWAAGAAVVAASVLLIATRPWEGKPDGPGDPNGQNAGDKSRGLDGVTDKDRDKAAADSLKADADRAVAQWILRGKHSPIQAKRLADGKELSIESLQHLPDGPFRVLALAVWDDVGLDPTFARIGELAELRSLSLNRLGTRHPGFKPFEKLEKLETLALLDVAMTDDDFAALAKLKRLSRLSLDRIRGLGPEAARHLAKWPALESLELMGDDLVTDRFLLALRGTGVKQLTLDLHPGLSAEGIEALLGFPQLADLALRDRLREGILQKTSQLRTLKRLSVTSLELTDESLRSIAGMQQLQGLHLKSAKKVTDSGLSHLAALRNLKNLGIRGSGATADGFRKLKAALPDCIVTHD